LVNERSEKERRKDPERAKEDLTFFSSSGRSGIGTVVLSIDVRCWRENEEDQLCW
jgi:hypothetical protein